MKHKLLTGPLLALFLLLCWSSTARAQDGYEIPTWDNVTPEQYEIAPFTSGWPWCAPGEFPSSYKWEAPCSPIDPCVETPIGTRTLWLALPCGFQSPEEPTVVVDIADPPAPAPFVSPPAPVELPATGTPSLALTLIATGLAALGIALTILAHTDKHSESNTQEADPQEG